MGRKSKKTIKLLLTNGVEFLCEFLPVGENFTLSNDPMLFDCKEIAREDILFFERDIEKVFEGFDKIYVL
jgi:hypothetical protein